MRKKKVLAVGVCATMLAAAMVGGTLAYLTDTDAQTNTFTVGDVKIDLWEDFGDNDDKGIEDLIPGVDVNKDVYVTNTGSNDAFVRVHVAIPQILDSGSTDFAAYANTLHWNFTNDSIADGKWNWNAASNGSNYPGNGGAWNFYTVNIPEDINGDGVNEDVWYNVYVATYESAVAPGQTTIDAISNVYLDEGVTNERVAEINAALGNDWKVRVVAEAVQTEGFRGMDDVDAYAALNKAFGEPGKYTVAWNAEAKGANFVTEVTADNALNVSGKLAGANPEGGLVENLRIYDATGADKNLRALYVTNFAQDGLQVVNCYLDGTYALNVNTSAPKGALAVENSTLKGWTSYSPMPDGATFTNCVFGWNSEGTYAHLRPYNDTTLSGCSFEKGFTIGVDAGKKVNIYLNDCTYDGQVLTAANFGQLLVSDDATSDYGLERNGCVVYVDGEKVAW